MSGLVGSLESPPKWASWLRIVVGAALIVFGIFRWLTRHQVPTHAGLDASAHQRHTREGGRLRRGIGGGEPEGAVHLRRSRSANRHRGDRRTPEHRWRSRLVARSPPLSVALPILAYAVSSDRLDGPLSKLKDSMERHNAALVAAILVVIGLLVLYKGVHGL